MAPGIDLVVVIGKNKGSARELTKAIEAIEEGNRRACGNAEGDELSARLEVGEMKVVDFETAVSPEFDWSWVVGEK